MAKYAATTSNLTEVTGIGWPISSRRLATAQTRPGDARATPIQRGARSPSVTLKAPATARMQAATANNQYQTMIENPMVNGNETPTRAASTIEMIM